MEAPTPLPPGTAAVVVAAGAGLRAGQPLRYGKDGNRVLVHAHGRIEAQVLEDGQPLPANAVVHDPTDPGLAQQLALMALPELPCALGIFRQVQAPVYGQAC